MIVLSMDHANESLTHSVIHSDSTDLQSTKNIKIIYELLFIYNARLASKQVQLK